MQQQNWIKNLKRRFLEKILGLHSPDFGCLYEACKQLTENDQLTVVWFFKLNVMAAICVSFSISNRFP